VNTLSADVNASRETPSSSSAVVGSEAANTSPGGRARARGLVLRAIRLYQLARHGRPSPCRFVPTCSEYAAEAVAAYGAVRGGILALRRISRCHPLGGRGFDPVPTKGGLL
jgi:uncharacterized protein